MCSDLFRSTLHRSFITATPSHMPSGLELQEAGPHSLLTETDAGGVKKQNKKKTLGFESLYAPSLGNCHLLLIPHICCEYGASSWEITYDDCEGIKFKRRKLLQLHLKSLIICFSLVCKYFMFPVILGLLCHPFRPIIWAVMFHWTPSTSSIV